MPLQWLSWNEGGERVSFRPAPLTVTISWASSAQLGEQWPCKPSVGSVREGLPLSTKNIEGVWHMSNFTDSQLESKIIGLKVHDRCHFWVDQTGALTLQSLTVDIKDLREIHRKAQSWLCERALYHTSSKSYPKTGENASGWSHTTEALWTVPGNRPGNSQTDLQRSNLRYAGSLPCLQGKEAVPTET